MTVHPEGHAQAQARSHSPTAERVYVASLVLIAGAFSVAFFALIVPGIFPIHDFVQQTLLNGYVNPTAAGYTTDTLACACVLTAWVIYERITLGIRGGWIALVVSVVPGVAVGFAAYLLIRMRGLRP